MKITRTQTGMLVLMALFITVLVFWGNRGYQDYFTGNPNENSRIYSAVSLIENGTFDWRPIFDRKGKLKWPFCIDRAVAPGKQVYSDKAPLTVLLSIPCYLMLKPFFLLTGTPPDLYTTTVWMRICQALIPFLIMLLFLYRILRQYVDEKTAFLSLLLLTLGTLAYSMSFFALGHTMVAMFGVLAAHFILVRRNLFLAGLFAGLGAITEFTLGAFCFFLFIYALFTEKKKLDVWKYAVGVLPSLLVLGIYNLAVWGNVFEISYNFVPNTGITEAFYTLTLRQIWSALFSLSRGIFLYSPVLLFAIPGFIRLYRSHKKEAILLAGTTLFYLLFLFGFKNFQGGWSPGMRHLTVALPFWTVGLAFGIHGLEEKGKLFRFAFFAAATASLFFNILPRLGYRAYPDFMPNPHYFAGLLRFWDKTFYPARLGDWGPLLETVLFFSILVTFLGLFFRRIIRTRMTLLKTGGLVTGLLLALGTAFLPLNYNTMEFIYAGYVRWQFYEMDHMDEKVANGCHGRISTDFRENQAIADLAVHRVMLSRKHDYKRLQKWYSDTAKRSPSWFLRKKKRYLYRIEYLKKKYGNIPSALPDKKRLAEIRSQADKFDRMMKTEKSLQRKRRMTEYLLYAGIIFEDGKRINKYMNLYQKLIRERLW